MAHAEMGPEGQFVTLPQGQVHAIVKGEGQDLVMIHGANSNARDFSFDLIDRMADDFRVIAFDRPGFGYSDSLGEPLSPMKQAELLRRAAQQLEVDQPIVLGHSYGGAVALAWALRAGDDVAGLTLLAPASHPWPGELGFWYQLSASALGQHVVLPMISHVVPRGLVEGSLERVFQPNEVPDGYLDHLGFGLTLRTSQMQINALQIDQLEGYLEAMVPEYPNLSIPIEVVHGRADRTVGLQYHAERLEAEVDSVNLTRVEGMGHMPHHADPERVADAIRRTAERAGVR
ncbi:alpha/beta fold hydrolase [Spiribacter curvatus]|nr:alpha/beta hydrolase [Spiribacter curvatus]